ncbi:MAG: gliding motility-associated C-terminal domain-containing protein [Chitinophagales bacterium]
MKRALFALTFILLNVSAIAQMHVKQPNFTSFNTDKKQVTPTLLQNSSAKAKQHPEFGVLPYTAQCRECVELIDQRTINSRQFINPNYEGQTYSQSSYFPLHYQKFEGDIWHTIDSRLRPDGPNKGVYVAANQPVPTKCDLNKKTASVTERGFEFEFSKNLTCYFFDEASVYTKAEIGDYTNYTIGEEGLNVKNLWSGIDLQQIFTTGEIKTNFVISAPLQLPVKSGWMVIEDHFTLPVGYTFEESKYGDHLKDGGYRGDYFLRNEQGDTLIVYEKPVYLDAKAFGMHGIYKLLKSGNDYTLQILVPVDWLNKNDHTYPILIDPIVYGQTKVGNFRLNGLSANMGFTSMALGSCDYHLPVVIPGRSQITNTYTDLEYQLTYDNTCGVPALPPPFCTFSQVTMEVVSDDCNTTTGLLACNPASPPYTGTCTTDSNLVPGANAIKINSFVPNYLACIPPQCPDDTLYFTLRNRDSVCLDQCGYLCARGNMWQMTIEACRVEGTAGQDKFQICAGEPVTFTAHPKCGVPPYHFIWSYGNAKDTVYGTPTLTIYPQQTIIMSCVIYDSCNKDSAIANDMDLVVVASPPAAAGNDVQLCEGGTAFLGGNPTSNLSATIQWTGSSPLVQSWLNSTSIQNPTGFVPAGTIDTFFYVVRASDFTCFRTDTVYVFSSPAPTADAGPDINICGGGNITLGGSPTSNAGSIVWSGENNTISTWLNSTTASNPSANVPSGTVDTFFYVVNTTTANCFNSDTVYVYSQPSPVADAGSNIVLCEGGTATLGGNPTATPGATVVWSGENAAADGYLSNNIVPNPTINIPAGIVDTFFYAVTASDLTCSRTDTVYVYSTQNPTVTIDTGGSTKICSNQSVTLFVAGSFASYSWSNGSTSSSINVNQAGPYAVTVTDASGCTAVSNSVSITTVPVPAVTVYPDTTILYGDSITLYTDINLSSASIDSFMWYPAVNINCPTCNNPIVIPQEASQYYSVSIFSSGCIASDSALIRVIFPNNFYIPNAFTPNGDGNNDGFYIQAQGGVRVILFQIFDRWGEKIHEGSYPWDGTYKGKPVPMGVYVYIFKLGLFGDDQSIFRKGSVTLIR